MYPKAKGPLQCPLIIYVGQSGQGNPYRHLAIYCRLCKPHFEHTGDISKCKDQRTHTKQPRPILPAACPAGKIPCSVALFVNQVSYFDENRKLGSAVCFGDLYIFKAHLLMTSSVVKIKLLAYMLCLSQCLRPCAVNEMRPQSPGPSGCSSSAATVSAILDTDALKWKSSCVNQCAINRTTSSDKSIQVLARGYHSNCTT